MIYSVLVFLLLLITGGCSKQKGAHLESPQSVPSQIGNRFDQVVDVNADLYSHSIFKIKSEMTGTQGVAIYLGEFNGKKLFITNKHIINESEDNCDSTIALLDLMDSIYLGCSEFIYSFKDIDITILAMDYVFDYKTDFIFVPLKLGRDELISNKLKLRTLDTNLNQIVIDKSEDCFVLNANTRFIIDPDSDEKESKIATWSLPIGCDGKPGDSGAPVFSADNDQVVLGLLWGGKYNKDYVSSKDLIEDYKNNSSRVWTEYNFMVPTHLIFKNLAEDLKQMDPMDLKYLVLSEFIK